MKQNKTVFQQLAENPVFSTPHGVYTTKEGIKIVLMGEVGSRDFCFNAMAKIELDPRLFPGRFFELSVTICQDNPAMYNVETITIHELWSMAVDLYTVDNGIVFFYVDKFGRDMMKISNGRRYERTEEMTLTEMLVCGEKEFYNILTAEQAKHVFVDAQAMQVAHPETFVAPNYEELARLGISDSVKVCTGNKRFWVKLVSINGDDLIGSVDDHLFMHGNEDLTGGTLIRFHKRNVYQIEEFVRSQTFLEV